MSSSSEEGCHTLNWKIENFELFLEAGENARLVAPYCEALIANDSWSQLAVSHFVSKLRFKFLRFVGVWKSELCSMTLISSSEEYELQTKSVPCFHHYIERSSIERIFANDRQSNLQNSTLTIRCKMHQRSMEAREFHTHSVLKRVSFHRSSLLPCRSDFEKDNILFTIESDIMIKPVCNRAIVQLEGQVGEEIFLSFVDCRFSCQKGANFICFCNAMRTRCDLNFDTLDNNMKNLNLQVNCIVAIHNSSPHQQEHHSSTETIKAENDYENVTTVSSTLGKDLLHLYREALHSDATLKADGKSFPVHKNILSARSEVFRAMFEKDRMSEGHSGVVDIDDADSGTVDRMLVYLYGDSLEDLQCEEAVALYYLADKYAIHLLKQKCANILKTGLTTDNVCAVLVLADAHSDEQLIEPIVDFLRDHQEVMSFSKWGKLEASHPRLTTKVMREIFLKKK